MDTALIVVILLLTFLLVLVILLYFYTQHGFRDLASRMAPDLAVPSAAAAKPQRNPDAVRRERSVAHDKLVLLEAELSITPREALTPEEIETFESTRKTIKACNDSLKSMGAWIGLPFDLEWVEIQQRQPQLNELYRAFVESTLEKAEQGNQPAAPPQSLSRL